MIKGVKKTNFTIEDILDKVSDYEIYRFYVGHDFVLGRTFHSPFRKENDPSFLIVVSKTGRLHHFDHGDPSKRGDCVDFVCQMYPGMNYGRALKLIARDLGIRDSPKGGQVKVISEARERKETLIQVVVKKYDTADLKYWGDYHITHNELIANDVYAVKKLYVNRERVMFSPTELVFGYLMDDKWKIYRPFAEKKHKWLSNIPHNYISGLSRIINNCEKGVITKAKKDEIVLAKFLPNVASVQSESEISISKENIDLITSSCKITYLNFDSDEVGVQSCKYYNQFGFKWVNCPKGFYTPEGKMVKDFADLAKYHGLETVINHFKQKGVYGG
jgi:hypothetical protein